MLAISEVTKRLLKPIGLSELDHVSLSLTEDERSFVARIYTPSDNGDGPGIPSYKSHNAISRIPERKRLSSSKNGIPKFQLGVSDYTVALLKANYEDRIYFKDETTKVVFFTNLLEARNSEEIASRTAQYFEDHTVPKNNLSIADGYEMTSFQQVAAINACFADGYGVFFKQGCGKTLVPISLISSFANHVKQKTGRMHRSLVICPNAVRLNWKNEIKRFCKCSIKSTIIEGSQGDRLRSLIHAFDDTGEDATVVIIGYDTLKVFYDALCSVNWDIGILDECQYIKSHSTKRWAFVEKIRDRCEKRLALTGTPMANSLLDLYTLFEWIGKGCSGFNSFEQFRKFHAVYEQAYDKSGKQDGIERLAGFQNVPFLQERLARHTFMITKKQALPDLPEKTYSILESTMTKEQTEVYSQLASQLMVEIEGSDFTSTLTTNHILTKLLRLAEITSGYAKWDDEVCKQTGKVLSYRIEFFNPIPKIETLVDLLKEKDEDEKTIVWSCFRAPIKKISKRLDQEGINHVIMYGSTSEKARKEAVHKFNADPECRVFVGNPTVGGIGLNLLGYDWWEKEPKLSTNANHHIYYCTNWSVLDREQSSDRSHRRGTRVPVKITDLVVPHTIDEEIRLRVVEKQLTALQLTDIRDILKSVLKMEVKV